jgi:hypothetical protein
MHGCLLSDDGSLGLAMSRAFGDFCLIDYGLNAAPNVFYRKYYHAMMGEFFRIVRSKRPSMCNLISLV